MIDGIILHFSSEMVVIDKNVKLVGTASHYCTTSKSSIPNIVMENGTVFTDVEMEKNDYKLVKKRDFDYHWKLMEKNSEFVAFSKVFGMIKKEHIGRLKKMFK